MNIKCIQRHETIGKTVSGFAEDCSLLIVAFTDGSAIAFQAGHAGCDDDPYFDWISELNVVSKRVRGVAHDCGLITDEQLQKLNTADSEKEITAQRREYERLKKKFEA